MEEEILLIPKTLLVLIKVENLNILNFKYTLQWIEIYRI